MTEEELWRCVGWISHGFEIVHSIFPAWRFTGPDTIVGYALHAALFIGPKVKVDETSNLPMRLRTFTVDLSRDGVLIETGGGANVLGSPLSAAKDFNDTLGTDAARPTLSAGEFVSTGTLTDAMPVRPNEIWETQLHGLPLAGVRLAIRQ
jgi:2-oxo-3-hexenedioate decarboxylase